jgi:hypothetical protein
MELLPTTSALNEKRPGREDPNAHWLNGLPAQVKSWRYRQKAVKYLIKIREELKSNQ